MSRMLDEWKEICRIEEKKKKLKTYSKRMTENPTRSEAKFKKIIKSAIKGKYRLACQKEFWDDRKKKGYIVDFYIYKLRVVIEIDGPYHQTARQTEYDQERTKFLNNIGIEVIRYTNEQVAKEDECKAKMIKDLNAYAFKQRINQMIKAGKVQRTRINEL